MPEFEFNCPWPRNPGRAARERLLSRSCLIGESGSPIGLQERAAIAERSGAHVFVSIHHDSVQPRYLERWTFEGRAQEHTTHARGFSLFVSAANRFFAASKEFAFIGSELRASRRPSVHYAEPIEGENHEVIHRLNGVHGFDELVVLRSVTIPAVLLEDGVIKHREEKLIVGPGRFRQI